MSLGASRATSTREFQLIDTGTITSIGSQSYTIPAGTRYLEVEMWGGGGGGGAVRTIGTGRSAVRYSGGGGGGGAYFKKTYYSAADMQENDVLRFTVGEGGSGGAVENVGVDGEDTTMDSHFRGVTLITMFSDMKAGGGSGGAISNLGVPALGGLGGVAQNGDINTNGDAGSNVTLPSPNVGGTGGDGADPNGGTGGAGAFATTGAFKGSLPGGGGGGGRNSSFGITRLGADGSYGKVIVEAYG